MKNLISLIVSILLTYSVNAQTKTERIKVWGNCDMCKKTIETAVKKEEGVKSASWNKKTKMITVEYDEAKTSTLTIQKAIAAAGYDTEQVRAEDEVYNDLHKCCKYERKKK
jgi:periplasmic mercuric ion binding protein